ncbi:hypothetical protein JCM11641_002963 [Rhodosporidiobolus odoratus]
MPARQDTLDATPASSRASTLCQTPRSPMAEIEKTPSKLHVADPDLRAKAEAPPGVIWVEWDGPEDPANPLNWSKRRKWLMSAVGIGFCALVSLSVSGYSISENRVREELHTSKELAILGITLFTLTFGAAPLLLAPLSEVYGRNSIYLASAIVFALFFIPQALAQNIETVLVSRFISGIAGSTAVSLVGGTLADVWRGSERGLPMALFSFSAFGSTGLGPVCFGYLAQIKGFRAPNWVLLALSAAFSVLIYFALDETRASVLLSRKAAQLRKDTGDERYISKDDFERGSLREMMKTSLGRPVQMLVREPVLIAMTAYISLTWGVLYLFLVAVPIVYGQVYGFNIGESGLVYFTQFLGSAIGLAFDAYCARYYHRNVGKRGPEARLYSAFGGGVCVPIGAFIFCFTTYSNVHWIASAIGMTILYVGMYLTYLVAFSYLADAYTIYASSALSAMSFVRNIVGAVFPLFTSQMYDALGIQGAAGLTAGLATVFAVIPFVIFVYGARLRARSPFAQELAKREAEEREQQGRVDEKGEVSEAAAVGMEARFAIVPLGAGGTAWRIRT